MKRVHLSVFPFLDMTLQIRTDLILSRKRTAEGETFVVKDPVTERFFSFREVEAYILEHLGKAESLEALRSDVEHKFGAELSLQDLEGFVDRIRRAGLLAGTTGSPQPLSSKRGRVKGDVFFLRVRLFDPDSLLDWMNQRLRFLFTKTFVVFSAACIVIALGITLTRMAEIQQNVFHLFHSYSLLLAWLIVLSVVGIHELSHGLACKRFGGGVHELGFLLIYFMPAFYCNVSDAWLFPEKSQRLLVTFAGAYSEVFVWALSTLSWSMTEMNTTLNNAAIVVMATSGIKTLFNWNPLIKLDGYYLLGDYLEIPNLRPRAFAYLGGKIRGLFGIKNAGEESSSREQWIYVTYGVLAFVYTIWLIGTFVLGFGEYLMAQYHGWGVLLFSFFLFGVLRYPVKKLAASSSAVWQKIRSSGKRGKVLGVLALTVTVMAVLQVPLTVSNSFVVMPLHNADLRSELDEIIVEVYVDEGDTVRAGDPIARLSDRTIRAEFEKVNSEIQEAEARLRLLKSGARPEEIKLAETQVAKAEGRLRYAQKDRERIKALFDRQLVSQKEYEEMEEGVSIRQKEWEEEKNKLSVLNAGSRPEQIQALRAEIGRLTTQRQFLEGQLALLEVKSPATGIVVTRRPKERVGEYVKKGELIAEVYELRRVRVEMHVSEKDVADVTVGQPVAARVRAFPLEKFSGTVQAIAPLAVKEHEWEEVRSFVVTVELNNDDLKLKPGMSGTAKIYCGKDSFLGLLERRIMRMINVEVWSWW